MVTIGAGQFTYEVQEGWGQLPAGYAFREVAAVGCDDDDNVYAFNRGEHPMMSSTRTETSSSPGAREFSRGPTA